MGRKILAKANNNLILEVSCEDDIGDFLRLTKTKNCSRVETINAVYYKGIKNYVRCVNVVSI